MEPISLEAPGELVHRIEDDQPDVVKKSLSLYAEQTQPLTNYYSNKELNLSADSEGTPKEVVENLMNAFNSSCIK